MTCCRRAIHVSFARVSNISKGYKKRAKNMHCSLIWHEYATEIMSAMVLVHKQRGHSENVNRVEWECTSFTNLNNKVTFSTPWIWFLYIFIFRTNEKYINRLDVLALSLLSLTAHQLDRTLPIRNEWKRFFLQRLLSTVFPITIMISSIEFWRKIDGRNKSTNQKKWLYCFYSIQEMLFVD